MKRELETNQEYSNRLNKTGWPNSYYGDYPNWYVFLGRSRDSDILEESNFQCALELLGGENEDTGVVIERAGHFAVGWVEHIAIDSTNADKVAIAENILDRLENYPVLDEEDYCRREMEQMEEEFESNYKYELAEYKDENEDIPESVIIKARKLMYEYQGYSEGIAWDKIKEKLDEEDVK